MADGLCWDKEWKPAIATLSVRAELIAKEKETAAAHIRQLRLRILAELLLDAQIIPASVVIPKFLVVREVMRTGRLPTGALNIAWEPIELDEEFYWQGVIELEKLTDLARWPHLQAERVRLDLQV